MVQSPNSDEDPPQKPSNRSDTCNTKVCFQLIKLLLTHKSREKKVPFFFPITFLDSESDSEGSEAILRVVEGSDLSFGSDQHPENREILLGVDPVRALGPSRKTGFKPIAYDHFFFICSQRGVMRALHK